MIYKNFYIKYKMSQQIIKEQAEKIQEDIENPNSGPNVLEVDEVLPSVKENPEEVEEIQKIEELEEPGSNTSAQSNIFSNITNKTDLGLDENTTYDIKYFKAIGCIDKILFSKKTTNKFL